MITVSLESPPGNKLQTRSFAPGQSLRIGAHFTGWMLPDPFTPIRIEVTGQNMPPVYEEVRANLLGDAWADVVLPDLPGKADIVVAATVNIFGPDRVVIPISIGDAIPDPVPTPVDKTNIAGVLDVLPLVLLGLVAYEVVKR